MYDKLTDRARKVMQLANQQAQRLNHEYLGTEHVLLGIAREGDGVAARVLAEFGGNFDRVDSEVRKIVKPGPDMVTMGKLPQTPRTKVAMESAFKMARDLGEGYVDTEHLLLGLLCEEQQEAIAYAVVKEIAGCIETVQGSLVESLGSQKRPQSPIHRRQPGAIEKDPTVIKIHIEACIAALKDEDGRAKTRELALAVTKLQEATMWIDEHLRLS